MATANELTKALDGFYERALRPEFERLNGRLGELDERIVGLDGRIGGLDGRIEGLDGRIGGLDGQVEGLDGRIGGLDGQVEGLDGRIGALDGRLGLLAVRMEGLELGLGRLDERVGQLAAVTAKRFQELSDRIEAVDNRLATFRIETLDRLSDLYGKFKSLEDEYHLIAAALRRLEMEGTPAQRAEWAGLAGRLEDVERRLRDVEGKVDRG